MGRTVVPQAKPMSEKETHEMVRIEDDLALLIALIIFEM
jgi:hypothetical protein